MALYPQGLSSSVGVELVTNRPLYISGTIWYVDSGVGSKPYYDGLSRKTPYQSLEVAVAAASAGDTILLMEGHEETLETTLALSKKLTIVGEGQTGGKPSVTFASNIASNGVLFNITDTVHLRNIRVLESLQANTSNRTQIGAANCVLEQCWFDAGQHDTGAVLHGTSAATGLHVVNSTIVSVATSSDAQPEYGFTYGAVGPLFLSGLTLDAGAYGFDDEEFLGTAAITAGIYGERISLLRGAVMELASGTVGWLMPTTATGGGRVIWPEAGSAGGVV